MSWSNFDTHSDSSAPDLLEKILQWDPAERCTIVDAMEHQYFVGIHDPNLVTDCHDVSSLFHISITTAPPTLRSSVIDIIYL